MSRVKDIRIQPISGVDAARVIKALHYSGKVVPNSQLHFGVYLDGRCGGAMSFGPSIQQSWSCQMVAGTKPREFLELNRMAFADWLPRNSESRCLAIALRMIKKSYPHIKWVISFADATQCGDGTIYRASGFVLTGITKNISLRIDPETNEPIHQVQAYHLGKQYEFKTWKALEGFQIRYIYFLHPEERANLTVPEIPFERLREMGASMYKGQRVGSSDGRCAPLPVARGRFESDPDAPIPDQVSSSEPENSD